jgi:hypothetical protein
LQPSGSAALQAWQCVARHELEPDRHRSIVMDHSFNWGALIPMWILGAPFIAGLIALMTTPRPRRLGERPGSLPA